MIAMGVAGLINAAMLIMAASTFHSAGLTQRRHHRGGPPDAGAAAGHRPPAGSSPSRCWPPACRPSSVGTMAGQVIMQGFLHRQIPVWLRRLVTMVPSLIVIVIGLDPTRTLVISQVVLSFGLPFAIIPLVMFTAGAT